MTNKLLTFIFTITILISGCSKNEPSIPDEKTDFSQISNELLTNIYPKINEITRNSKDTKAIYVTDFVNLEELENHSKFGFLLSEEVKATVTNNTNMAINEIEFTKYLMIGSNGTKLLSRNIDELKETALNPYTYALVGTYVLTKKQAIIYMKLISLKNGVIVKSTSKAIPMTQEIMELNGIVVEDPTPKQEVQEVPIYQPVVL